MRRFVLDVQTQAQNTNAKHKLKVNTEPIERLLELQLRQNGLASHENYSRQRAT